MTDRPTFESFKAKALKNPEVKAAYDEAAPAHAMKRDMIAMRTAAGKTQAQMAELMGTKKSNISRLESVNSEISPRLATVENYARLLGYRVKVGIRARTVKTTMNSGGGVAKQARSATGRRRRPRRRTSGRGNGGIECHFETSAMVRIRPDTQRNVFRGEGEWKCETKLQGLLYRLPGCGVSRGHRPIRSRKCYTVPNF